MNGACKLNNKNMRNIRKNEAYQCLAIDFAMLGVISKEECEMLIGSGIPRGLVLPNGKQGVFISENNLPKKPAFIQTEPVDTEPVDIEPVYTEPVDTETVDTNDNESRDPEPGNNTQEPLDDEGRTESDN